MLSWFKDGSLSDRPPLTSLGWTAIAFLTGPVSWVICLVLVITVSFMKYLLILYLMWMFLDRNSCIKSERRWNWLRNMSWWKWHRDYFPIKLVKTCDLPPDRNYLFALYPHGVFSYGLLTSFTTDALDFEKKFPGINLFLCTLNIVFRLPVLREFALGHGLSSVSKESLSEILSSSRKGTAAAVVVGGAAEAALSKPNEYKILLSRRKGFCKIALRHGCDIVPVYSFGESDLYDIYEPADGSILHKLQIWFKKLTTIYPVMFYGVGPLCFFPKRVPITITVGKPIKVKKIDEPTEKDVTELHSRFKESILQLFNEHKGKYLRNKNAELKFC